MSCKYTDLKCKSLSQHRTVPFGNNDKASKISLSPGEGASDLNQKLKKREVERIITVSEENRTPEHKPKKVEEDGLKG